LFQVPLPWRIWFDLRR